MELLLWFCLDAAGLPAELAGEGVFRKCLAGVTARAGEFPMPRRAGEAPTRAGELPIRAGEPPAPRRYGEPLVNSAGELALRAGELATPARNGDAGGGRQSPASAAPGRGGGGLSEAGPSCTSALTDGSSALLVASNAMSAALLGASSELLDCFGGRGGLGGSSMLPLLLLLLPPPVATCGGLSRASSSQRIGENQSNTSSVSEAVLYRCGDWKTNDRGCRRADVEGLAFRGMPARGDGVFRNSPAAAPKDVVGSRRLGVDDCDAGDSGGASMAAVS